MSAVVPELLVKSPVDCSNIEIGVFISFIRAGGEVAVQGLTERIRSAAAIVFAHVNGVVEGVAALKQPQSSYRRRVSSESATPLSATEFPYELGWVYVLPESRGNGLSLLLTQAAVAEANGAGVFATSRTDNIAMHRSLVKVGFVPVGEPYVSGRGNYSLQVFVRHVAQPIIPADAAQ